VRTTLSRSPEELLERKLEILSTNFETNSNDQNVLNFENLNFENCFGFRYSNLEFLKVWDLN